MANAYCPLCKSVLPNPHTTDCPNHPMNKYNGSGRQQGKTDLAFEIALDRLEAGDTVFGIKLSDE